MRNILIIGMLGVAAFMAGWFTINRDGDKTTIEFNRAEIRNDTRRAIDKGREVLDRKSQQYANQPDAGYTPQSGQPIASDDRGFGQPASYGQPVPYSPSAYPPASYGNSYPPSPPSYQGQPTPYQGQPAAYQGQPIPYPGQSAQYPPQPQSAYPRR